MSTLLNVPPVSQLTTVTDEKGEISTNAQQDCTAAGVDMLCRYVLGTPENSIFNPDNLKDHAYGDAYVGGTAAIEYVAYCKSLGVHLYSVQASDYSHLVALARSYIRDKKMPCLFTRDDPYVDRRVHPDWTHVCVFKGEDNAGLSAHDPYINQLVYKTDAGWMDILRSNEIWLAEKIVQPAVISGVPEGWHYDQASHTLTAPNGVQVKYGFCDEVMKGGWPTWCHPVVNQYYRDPLEDSNEALGPGDQQPFYDRVLGYPHNPQHPFEGLKNKVIVEYAGKELVTARQIADARWQQVQKYYTLAKSLHDTAIAVQADNVKLATDNAKLQADVQALQQALPK